MPTWLLTVGGFLLKKTLPWIWHQISRAWGVFLVGSIIAIALLRFHAFKSNIYELGYKAGYRQCGIDHPTNSVSAGGIINYYSDKSGWVDLKMLKLFRIVIIPKN
jgi:hypothetical protein